jgi:hypothetical protein
MIEDVDRCLLLGETRTQKIWSSMSPCDPKPTLNSFGGVPNGRTRKARPLSPTCQFVLQISL